MCDGSSADYCCIHHTSLDIKQSLAALDISTYLNGDNLMLPFLTFDVLYSIGK